MSIFNFRATKIENVIDKLQTGDVLLYRGRGVASFFISGLTDSRYTHVGILFFENGEPMVKIVDKPSRLDRAFVAHFREWKGGIIVSLKREVKRYRGRIDVYRPSKEFPVVAINFDGTVNESTIPYDGNRVANKIKALTGIDYGWSRIAVLWARKWFGLRLFTKKTGEVTDIASAIRDDPFEDPIDGVKYNFLFIIPCLDESENDITPFTESGAVYDMVIRFIPFIGGNKYAIQKTIRIECV